VISLWYRIGWRNLGRNRRRSLITALGLAFGYFAVVFLVGWADGLKAEMIESGTGLLSGQLQIHSLDYRPERSLYETIGGNDGVDVEELVATVAADPVVSAATPRVYAGGLVSSGNATSAGMLMGIDAKREVGVSRILSGLLSGRAPADNAKELLVGDEMARQLGVEVGDEVVVVAPAADGSMGNDLFRVTGIFHSGMANVDSSYTLVALGPLQELLALDSSRVHEIAAATMRDPWLAPQAADRLRERFDSMDFPVEVEPWTRLRPEMLDYVRLLESWYFIVIVIVFAVAVFGVANTMLMATFERRREFAVMLALGTTPRQIVTIIVAEAIAMGALSLLLGAIVTFPTIAWLHHVEIDLSFIYGDFTMLGALMRPTLRVEYNVSAAAWSAVALLLTALVAALYPAARAARIPPADTLSGL
jgi:putative ABC transport system permease protein